MTIINSVIKGKQPVIDTLNVNPTTSAQQITAPSGTDGYSPVNVSAVTSSIDANIVAGNIKKDVTILGVTGSFEGGVTPTGTISITANGTYDVTDYENASVNVPTTVPDFYIDKTVTNGVLSAGTHIPSMSGITEVTSGCLYSAFSGADMTSVPDFSDLTTVQNSGLSKAFSAGSSVSQMTGEIDLSNLTSIGQEGMSSAFEGRKGSFTVKFNTTSPISCGLRGIASMFLNSDLSGSVDISHLSLSSNCAASAFSNTKITSIKMPSGEFGSNEFGFICSGCTYLTNIDVSGVTNIRNAAFDSAFSRCTALTSVDFSSLTTADSYCMRGCFSGCTSLSSALFNSLTEIKGYQAFQNAFNGCSSLTRIDFPLLTKITSQYAFQQAFNSCTALEYVGFKNLEICDQIQCFNYAFGGTNIHTMKFESLKSVKSNPFYMAGLGKPDGSTIYFYALNTDSFGTYTNVFTNMLDSGRGCVVHFPIRIQSTISSWADVINGFGGQNTTVLFDIVTTVVGADTNTYTRQEKDSTQTATAWNFNDVLYYTSGLTEPQVGDTIYSDDTCTAAVTTIDSIA